MLSFSSLPVSAFYFCEMVYGVVYAIVLSTFLSCNYYMVIVLKSYVL